MLLGLGPNSTAWAAEEEDSESPEADEDEAPATPEAPEAPSGATPEPQPDPEVEALKAQVTTLEDRLRRLEQPAPRADTDGDEESEEQPGLDEQLRALLSRMGTDANAAVPVAA